ncbi:uncharacterized protein LOC115199087 [Salmo trutta]|uniref:uncharacterized protein LOC115199087 n=1 Tax=Salmo trutta TaxID=8032 RepID=UPI001131BB53|nr:uncharacterized protein LOC115199087 [Salmo trutta]
MRLICGRNPTRRRRDEGRKRRSALRCGPFTVLANMDATMENIEHTLPLYSNNAKKKSKKKVNSEYTYKLSEYETMDFVKLRVSNRYMFTGRRNASRLAWRAILKHMGLQGKMTASQAMKKWENLKKRYKELKYPPPGVQVFPHSWRWYDLMSDAMEGRLAGSAPIIGPLPPGTSDSDFLPDARPRKRSMMGGIGVMGMHCDLDEMDTERATLETERAALEGEREVMGRERMALEREQAGLEREMANLDRERAQLEREKAAVERERGLIEKEKAQVARDRLAVDRDRVLLAEGRSAEENGAEGQSCKTGGQRVVGSLERTERFLKMFEKLVERM